MSEMQTLKDALARSFRTRYPKDFLSLSNAFSKDQIPESTR